MVSFSSSVVSFCLFNIYWLHLRRLKDNSKSNPDRLLPIQQKLYYNAKF